MPTETTQLSADMKAAVELALNGQLPNNLGAIKARRHIFSHRQVLTDGTTQTIAASYTCFNANRAMGVTNMFLPQQLPANYAYLIAGVSVFCTSAVTLAFANDDEIETIKVDGSSGTEALDMSEWIREIHDCGVVSCLVGDFLLIDSIVGLKNFPAGGGIQGVGGVGTSATTSNIVNNALTNGVPVNGNRYTFPNPYPWLAGNALQFTVNFPGGPAAPTGAPTVLWTELDGILINRTT